MPPTISNKIYGFEASVPVGKTKVHVQAPHGMSDGVVVEILHSSLYIGTYVIESVGTSSFVIDTPFTVDEYNCAWQVTRGRPVLVNPEGESIDTLRQAVNQVGNDLGNKEELNSVIDQRDIVKAINSIDDNMKTEERIRNLINAIACN